MTLSNSSSDNERALWVLNRTLFVLVILAALVPESLAEQSANKIIDRYKKASGGSAAPRIKSTLMTGTAKSLDGSIGRFTLQTYFPNSMLIDIDAGSFKERECYNGKSAWRLDARGLRTLLGEEAKRLRLDALLAGTRLRDLKRNRIVAQLAGKASINGRDATAIDFTRDNVRAKLYFDATSNLLLKQERESADGNQEIFYGDYRQVDGVMEAFSIRLKRGPTELLVTIDRVEHNRNVDLAVFRYPQVEGARPLPDLEPLLKAITANQEKVEQTRERYTFRLVQVERKHDGDGRVKETETRVFEVTPVAGDFVERLVSVNGKELSASEREKEDKRVLKEVEEVLKRREKELQQKERARARGETEEKNSDQLTVGDFLRISEITSVRREMFRGYEVIAFDFEPRKEFKPKGRAEQIANKLAGTIWVDESARQVARLEARLTDSFKIGGGVLASVAPSTAFVFEQEKIGDEVWLPSLMEANLSLRVMLFAKFNRSMERRYSEYKKHHIDSKYDLSKPSETKP